MNTLLITGGTGSFGSTVLERVLSDNLYNKVKIFSRDELKQENLRTRFSNPKLEFIIGDIRDRQRIHDAMRGVTHVFCAAALKQVPSCEFNPMEAVNTNIIGTKNTIDAAIENGVSRVVVLSTDKAVYPINAMGISKAMMEKIAISSSLFQNHTKINVTRYGNVMGSRGSVIPFFIERLKGNLFLPITDYKMTRFMMSLTESVDLVLHALSSNNTGSIFVHKAPSADILTLVKALEVLTEKKASIKPIGIRHGEKLHEALLSVEERMRAFETERYFEVPKDHRDTNYIMPQTGITMVKSQKIDLSFSSNTVKLLDVESLVNKINKAGISCE